MKLHNILKTTILTLLIVACNGSDEKKKNNFSIKTNAKNNTVALNSPLKLTINNPKKLEINRVSYKLNSNPVTDNFTVKDIRLGYQTLTATVTYNGDESEEVNQNITILNNKAPKILKFEIVNTYPHDKSSYTQGLEFKDGVLYESTGQYGTSKIRIVDFKTGDVVKNVNLSQDYFGEGLTILGDKAYQLTWLKNKGFIYNAETLERTGSFNYGKSKQGWGLCNDGTNIYKTDGTERIWTLNANTLAETESLQVYTNTGKIGKLNELEWINGKIFSNIYQRNGVAIINPKNGATEALIDFTPLKKKITINSDFDHTNNVLNGIAYNPETETIFVTGKRWDKLFEIKLIE